jgi:hypothetical protein
MPRRTQDFIRIFLVLLGCCLSCPSLAAESPKGQSAKSPLSQVDPAPGDSDTPAYWLPAQRELAELAEGVLVWESRRTGTWRIWTMRLDGTGMRQLTVDEAGRDHYCPKLSPDGRRLTYLSLSEEAQKDNLDRPRDVSGQLHLINIDGSDDRVIVERAHKYNGWDRAVTWFDNDVLAYIDGEGNTQRLNLATNQHELLIKGGQFWLPNTKLTHAVWSFNTFSLLDAARQTVTPMPHLGGCQPYFAHDGNWGFWVRAPGGPLYKMHLATRAISPLFDRGLLPANRDYCYFPMISMNQRLLAFAAADHHKIVGAYGGYVLSDYEIFLLPIDPGTLEPLGKPIRYTFEPHCDRFPDVHQDEPALGYYSNEAPFDVQLSAAGADGQPGGADRQWNYGDGTVETARAGRHTYDKPGVYLVESHAGGQVLRGQVRVSEAVAPRVTGGAMDGEKDLVVTFSEPVELGKASLSLASGAKIERFAAGEDGRSLRVVLAAKPKQNDRLLLADITDRAQHPNRLERGVVDVVASSWPSNPAGLAFLWQTADKPNTLRDPLTGQIAAYAPKANSRVWFDRNQAMVLDGGSYYFSGLLDQIANAVRKTHELSVELTLTPATNNSDRAGCVLSYGVSQVRDRLMFHLNGSAVELCSLPAGEASHIVVTYKPGQLVCYRNGQAVFASDKVKGDLSGYPSMPMNIGNNLDGQVWRGTVEGVALYSRALPADEARANFDAYRQLRDSRPRVESLELDARLLSSSEVPTLKQIEPYRQALIVNEYEVKRLIRGQYATPKIRVAHWAMLDETTQPIARLAVGQDIKLLVEPLVDQPQLADQYTSNTLEDDFDLPVYYCVSDDAARHAVPEWNVVAMGGGDAKEVLDKPLGPEGQLNLPQSWPAPAGLSWQVVKAGGDGYANLGTLSRPGLGLGYAVAYVKSPTRREAKISLGTVGGLKCWVNGREALAGQFGRYPFLGYRQAEVELTEGWNEVLVKSTQLYAFWGFQCELLTPAGKAMPDLSYAVQP